MWAAAFAGVGAVIGVGLVVGIASGVLPPPRYSRDDFYLMVVLSRTARWAAIGALSGLAFAGTILVAERRQTIASLSARRLARWGLLAGALGPVAMVAAVAAFMLRDGALASSIWLLAIGFAAAPVVGGMLGRATAAATQRAARGDLLGPTSPGEEPGEAAMLTDRAP